MYPIFTGACTASCWLQWIKLNWYWNYHLLKKNRLRMLPIFCVVHNYQFCINIVFMRNNIFDAPWVIIIWKVIYSTFHLHINKHSHFIYAPNFNIEMSEKKQRSGCQENLQIIGVFSSLVISQNFFWERKKGRKIFLLMQSIHLKFVGVFLTFIKSTVLIFLYFKSNLLELITELVFESFWNKSQYILTHLCSWKLVCFWYIHTYNGIVIYPIIHILTYD